MGFIGDLLRRGNSGLATLAVLPSILLLLPGLASAAVITNNNLSSLSLGTLTATSPTQASVSFAVGAHRLVGATSNVTMTTAGGLVNGYHVDALSALAAPTSLTDLAWTTGNFAPVPASYSKTHVLTVATGSNSSLYYNLGVGRSDVGMFGYNWQATGITAYQPAGRDEGMLTGWKGNLVPNAGFEDTAISFWNGGTVMTDGAGVQGNNYLRNTSTADVHIGVPVEFGKSYNYSIWVRTTGGDQFEYGFTVPADGYAIAAGNSTFNASGTWSERTGTITPASGQTMWYFGAMTNGSAVYFDSVYIQEIPEPATLIVAGVAGVALLRGRRRR